MQTPKIVFLEVDEIDRDEVKNAFPNAVIETAVLTEDEIIEKHKDTEVLCVFIYSPITKKVIESLPNLQCIVTRSVGYNHIDLEAARKRKIPVGNVPDYGSHVIAEHVFALLLSSIRNIIEGDERVDKERLYDFRGLRGIALKGKTLGIIGTGKIGRITARIASRGFLMNVNAFDVEPNEELAEAYDFSYVSLEEIWEKSDIISLHVPLLESTKHLVSNGTISKMKDGVVIINTSRGGVIDTKALVKGLKSGKISHAALDVLEHEKNLEDEKELIELPGVIITPHIAFYADDSMRRMYSEAIISLKEYLAGNELPNQVEGV